MTLEYVGPNRRKSHGNDPVTLDDLDEALAAHAANERAYVNEMIASVMVAFPDGPVKHGEYHQTKINAAKDEAEFWKAAKMELTKVGVSALAGVVKTVLVLAVVGLLYKLGLGAVVAGSLPK